ncbi:hypothetical protein H5T89_07065 [bacterium]|nr:hypothetical protein [bacterium]
MSKKTYALFIVTITLMVFFSFIQQVLSQVNISVTPLFNEITSYPGVTKSFEILLVNEGDPSSVGNFRIRPVPVKVNRTGYFQLLGKDETNPWDCSEWIKVSPSEVTLRGQEGKIIECTITIPRGVNGSRYSAILFELLPEKKTPTGEEEGVASLTITTQILSIVSVTIPGGKIDRKVNLVEFNVENVKIENSNMIAFTALLKNQGNVTVQTKGTLIIKSRLGRRIREIPLGGGMGLLFPGADAELRSIIRMLPPGEYIADAYIRYGVPTTLKTSIPFSVTTGEAKLGTLAEGKGIDVVAEPSLQEITAPPGSFRSSVITIQNMTEKPVDVKVNAKPVALGSDGEISDTEDTRYSCIDWIKIDTNSFILKPKERHSVRVNVTPPRDIKSGGRYANVSFEVSDPSSKEGLVTTLDTLYLVTIPGELKYSGEVQDIRLVGVGESVFPQFLALFRNTGNIHLKTNAVLTIKTKGTDKEKPKVLIEELPFSDGEVIVLPDGVRQFMLLYTQPLEPGEYIVTAKVNFGDKKWAVLEKEFKIEKKEEVKE